MDAWSIDGSRRFLAVLADTTRARLLSSSHDMSSDESGSQRPMQSSSICCICVLQLHHHGLPDSSELISWEDDNSLARVVSASTARKRRDPSIDQASFNQISLLYYHSNLHCPHFLATKALFRAKIFLDFDTVAISFLFDKHYPIMEQLGLKD